MLGNQDLTDSAEVQNSQRIVTQQLREEAADFSEESASDSEGEDGTDIGTNPNIRPRNDPIQDDESDWEDRDETDFQLNVAADVPMNSRTLYEKIGSLIWKFAMHTNQFTISVVLGAPFVIWSIDGLLTERKSLVLV